MRKRLIGLVLAVLTIAALTSGSTPASASTPTFSPGNSVSTGAFGLACTKSGINSEYYYKACADYHYSDYGHFLWVYTSVACFDAYSQAPVRCGGILWTQAYIQWDTYFSPTVFEKGCGFYGGSACPSATGFTINSVREWLETGTHGPFNGYGQFEVMMPGDETGDLARVPTYDVKVTHAP